MIARIGLALRTHLLGVADQTHERRVVKARTLRARPHEVKSLLQMVRGAAARERASAYAA